MVSALALDGVEVERRELLAGAVGERTLDLVPRYNWTDAGRRAGKDQVSLLQRSSEQHVHLDQKKLTSRVMMVEM